MVPGVCVGRAGADMKTKAPSPKAEALRALEHALARLASGEPLDGLARMHFQATLEYAKEQLGQIQELQRARRQQGADHAS